MVKIYQIELTNRCNLNCSFCPNRYDWSIRKKGFMDIEMLDRIDFSDTRYLELQLSGEPMLHPLVSEFVKKLRKINPLMKIGLATNGTIKSDYSIFDLVTITEDIERKFLLSGKNIRHQSLGVSAPYEDYSHVNKEMSFDKNLCKTPFNYVSIQWDGKVVPCCKCQGYQDVIGDLTVNTFEEIINSVARSKFLTNLNDNYSCQYCQFINPHLIHYKLLSSLVEV